MKFDKTIRYPFRIEKTKSKQKCYLMHIKEYIGQY